MVYREVFIRVYAKSQTPIFTFERFVACGEKVSLVLPVRCPVIAGMHLMIGWPEFIPESDVYSVVPAIQNWSRCGLRPWSVHDNNPTDSGHVVMVRYPEKEVQ
jgi:hypothetical protein